MRILSVFCSPLSSRNFHACCDLMEDDERKCPMRDTGRAVKGSFEPSQRARIELFLPTRSHAPAINVLYSYALFGSVLCLFPTLRPVHRSPNALSCIFLIELSSFGFTSPK
ncbi:unnamed protein product [Scytosiphon promiscuus]